MSTDYLAKAAEQLAAAANRAQNLNGEKAAQVHLEVSKGFADLAAVAEAIGRGKVTVTLGVVVPGVTDPV